MEVLSVDCRNGHTIIKNESNLMSTHNINSAILKLDKDQISIILYDINSVYFLIYFMFSFLCFLVWYFLLFSRGMV